MKPENTEYFFAVNAAEYEAYTIRKDFTSVIIPDGITEIGDWAFSYCTGLMSVIIPDSVTKIGNGAFSNCIGQKNCRDSGVCDGYRNKSIPARSETDHLQRKFFQRPGNFR